MQGPCLSAQRRRAGARRGLCWFQRTSVSSCCCACQPGVLLSAVLTSKFMSSPLLFPGSSPISHLSASGLAARRAAQGEEERTVPARGFSQAFFSPFGRGLPAGSESSLPSLGNAFAFCCHICPCPCPRNQLWQAGAGVLPSHHFKYPCGMLRNQCPPPDTLALL